MSIGFYLNNKKCSYVLLQILVVLCVISGTIIGASLVSAQDTADSAEPAAISGSDVFSQSSGTGPEWPMFRYTNEDGYNPNTLAPQRDITLDWSTDSGENGPIVYDGKLFVVSGDGSDGIVEAFDLETGNSLWSHDLGAGSLTPVVSNGHVVVADSGGGSLDDVNAKVRGFDPDTGTQVWETSALGEHFVGDPIIASASSVCVRAYNPEYDDNNRNVEIDTASGTTESWGCSTYGETQTAQKGSWTYTLMTEQDGRLVATESGVTKWEFNPTGTLSSPTIADGLIFVGISGTSSNNGIVALDESTGSVQWKYDTSDGIGKEVVVAGGDIYATATWPDSGVYKLSGQLDTALSITANTSSPSNGDAVQLTVTRTDSGEYVDAEVTVNGSTISTGADGNVTYAFDEFGDFSATASKSSTSDATFQPDSTVISVRDTTPPVADAGSNQSVYEESEFAVNASNSTDNYHIQHYLWEFGDGTSSTAISPTHTYADPGTNTVTLTVTDRDGNSDTDEIQIDVDPDSNPPTLLGKIPSGDLPYGQTNATIRFDYQDMETTINTSSTELNFSSTNVTTDPETTITKSNAVYNATGLSPGETYNATITLTDIVGNEKSYRTNFTVVEDTTVPTIDATSPQDGVQLDSATTSTTVTVKYSDKQSGVDTSSVEAFFDGRNVTQSASLSAAQLTYTASGLSDDSTHSFTISNLTDMDGNGPIAKTINFSVAAAEDTSLGEQTGGTGDGGGSVGGSGGSVGGGSGSDPPTPTSTRTPMNSTGNRDSDSQAVSDEQTESNATAEQPTEMSPSETESPTTVESSTEVSPTSTDAVTTADGASGPGFTMVSAVIAAVLALLWTRRTVAH